MEALAQIAAQLGLDRSFYYLFGMMFVLHLLLSVAYLSPFQRLLSDRKAKTEGAKKEAEELKSKAEREFETYKSRLKQLHEQARTTLREREDNAKKEEAKILAEAAEKAKVSLQATQKELEAQRKAIVERLAGEITGIADDIANKVMGHR